MFLGCLGYFCLRLCPLSWEHHENMPSWHNNDKTPKPRLLQHEGREPRSPWQHAKLTLPQQHTMPRFLQHTKQFAVHFKQKWQDDITIATQGKRAPTPWSHCTHRDWFHIRSILMSHHQKLRSSLLTQPRLPWQQPNITNRDDVDFTPRVHLYECAHPNSHDHRPHCSEIVANISPC